MLAINEQDKVFGVFLEPLADFDTQLPCTHPIFIFLLFSQASESFILLFRKWFLELLALEVAGHFYSVYYEADSTGSPSHKCITVNHNIPRHPVRPWRMTA